MFAAPVRFPVNPDDPDEQTAVAVIKCQFGNADKTASLAELVQRLLTFKMRSCYERMEELAYVRMLEGLLGLQEHTLSVSCGVECGHGQLVGSRSLGGNSAAHACTLSDA